MLPTFTSADAWATTAPARCWLRRRGSRAAESLAGHELGPGRHWPILFWTFAGPARTAGLAQESACTEIMMAACARIRGRESGNKASLGWTRFPGFRAEKGRARCPGAPDAHTARVRGQAGSPIAMSESGCAQLAQSRRIVGAAEKLSACCRGVDRSAARLRETVRK